MTQLEGMVKVAELYILLPVKLKWKEGCFRWYFYGHIKYSEQLSLEALCYRKIL